MSRTGTGEILGVMENLGEGEYELVVAGVFPMPGSVTVASDMGGPDTAAVEID